LPIISNTILIGLKLQAFLFPTDKSQIAFYRYEYYEVSH